MLLLPRAVVDLSYKVYDATDVELPWYTTVLNPGTFKERATASERHAVCAKGAAQPLGVPTSWSRKPRNACSCKYLPIFSLVLLGIVNCQGVPLSLFTLTEENQSSGHLIEATNVDQTA